MNAQHCPVMVFAKAPQPGQVKTRLIPMLGKTGAAILHKNLLWRSLSTATASGCGPAQLWCSPSAEHPFFRLCARKFRVALFNQCEGDLGTRMGHAFATALSSASRALVIGADSPSLRPADLLQAAGALRDGADAVLGPAVDGGYVLLGLRRFAPELFSDIEWGSGQVLRRTRANLRSLGWRWHELPERWDIDRPEDILRLDTAYPDLSPLPRLGDMPDERRRAFP